MSLHVSMHFYECESSVCLRVCLQVCGRSGTFRELCRQQRFYKCLLCIEINTLRPSGDELDPMLAVFHNHLHLKDTVFPHIGAHLYVFYNQMKVSHRDGQKKLRMAQTFLN